MPPNDPVAPATPGAPNPASLSTPEVQEAFDNLPDDVLDGLTAKPAAEPDPAAPAVPDPATPAPVAPAPAPASVAAPAPAATPAPAAPVAQPAPAPAAATPAAAPVAPAAAPASTATPNDPAAIVVQPDAVIETPDQKAAREAKAKEVRDATVAKLQDLYKLSEDDAKAMLLNPETVLPKLAAKLHMDVTESVLASLDVLVPQHIALHAHVTEKGKAARKLLFDAWPGLDKPEYETLLAEVGKMYRKTNKTATPDEAVKAIGRLAYAALGQPVPGDPPAPAAPAATPAAPVHRPAAPGSGTAPKPPAAKNEFSDLAGDAPGSG